MLMNDFWENQLESGYYDKILTKGKQKNSGIQSNWHDLTFQKISAYLNNEDYLTSLDTKSYRSSGVVTIDMILDERAREFMGEGLRWYDLKRTGKLIERAKAMNPWVGDLNFIQEYHLLRPIPLKEIDLSSNGITQNPGY